jgi:hypothetical protein
MNCAKKWAAIAASDAKLSPDDFLVFHSPEPNLLYTPEELMSLCQPLVGRKIPAGLGNVQKGHWAKKQLVALLGYRQPAGLRTKQAKKSKPKFHHQLLDIFVQARRNLQPWNYIPYADLDVPGEWNVSTPPTRFCDCRYIIVHHKKTGEITHITIHSGSDLAPWDKTGTKTVKWQANASSTLRKRIKGEVACSKEDPLFALSAYPTPSEPVADRTKKIHDADTNLLSPLVKKAPDPALLLRVAEIADRLKSCIGLKTVNPGVGQERVVGQQMEKRIVEALGYRHFKQTDSGGYPDLLHQLLEVKFQVRGTIDLGRNLPDDPQKIKAAWNKGGVANEHVRYVVCLVDAPDAVSFQIESIVVCSGKDFEEHFVLCQGTNDKVQLVIPLRVATPPTV